MNEETKEIEIGKSIPAGPGYMEIIFIALVVAACAIYGYDRYLVPKMSVFDMKGYIKEQKELLSTGKITETQFAQGLDKLDQMFKTLPKNETLILKDVVLKNGSSREVDLK